MSNNLEPFTTERRAALCAPRAEYDRAVAVQQLQSKYSGSAIQKVAVSQAQSMAQIQPRVSDIKLRNKDLETPLFDAPLSTLSALWLARFGLGWVSETRIMAAVQEPESEWGLLFSRLNARNAFERHPLYDRGEDVFRLIQE